MNEDYEIRSRQKFLK